MSERVSIEADGAAEARRALERCVGEGGVAVFPADGLYGLCCDPLSATAIERIHRIKGRDEGKPSAVLYFDGLVMRELLGGLGPRAASAAGALLPGPVTLVIANPERRYPLACGDDPSRLGVRLIGGPLSGARMPVFQTSANRSGEPAPASAAALDPDVAEAADLVIDGGELTGEPSTVVDVSDLDGGGSWRLLREGAVPRERIEDALSR